MLRVATRASLQRVRCGIREEQADTWYAHLAYAFDEARRLRQHLSVEHAVVQVHFFFFCRGIDSGRNAHAHQRGHIGWAHW